MGITPLLSRIAPWVLLFLVGLSVLVFNLTRDHDEDVTCNGVAMSRGDVCVTTRNNHSTSYSSYSDMQQGDSSGQVYSVLISGAATAIGAVMVIRRVREHRQNTGRSRTDP